MDDVSDFYFICVDRYCLGMGICKINLYLFRHCNAFGLELYSEFHLFERTNRKGDMDIVGTESKNYSQLFHLFSGLLFSDAVVHRVEYIFIDIAQ